MYKCPAGCSADGPQAFAREEHVIGLAMLNADGTETAYKPARREPAGHVKCAKCDARAEWIDSRQMEMFAVAPSMF